MFPGNIFGTDKRKSANPEPEPQTACKSLWYPAKLCNLSYIQCQAGANVCVCLNYWFFMPVREQPGRQTWPKGGSMVWNVSKDTAITLPPTTITIITQEVTGACKAAPNTRNIKNTHTYKHAKTCKNASTCTVTAYCSTATPHRSSAYYPFYVAEFKFPQQSRRQKSTQYSDDSDSDWGSDSDSAAFSFSSAALFMFQFAECFVANCTVYSTESCAVAVAMFYVFSTTKSKSNNSNSNGSSRVSVSSVQFQFLFSLFKLNMKQTSTLTSLLMNTHTHTCIQTLLYLYCFPVRFVLFSPLFMYGFNSFSFFNEHTYKHE